MSVVTAIIIPYNKTIRKQNKTKRNETKRNETKRNETKRNKTKQNKTKQNEEYIYSSTTATEAMAAKFQRYDNNMQDIDSKCW
jgi:hypothetical protein